MSRAYPPPVVHVLSDSSNSNDDESQTEPSSEYTTPDTSHNTGGSECDSREGQPGAMSPTESVRKWLVNEESDGSATPDPRCSDGHIRVVSGDPCAHQQQLAVLQNAIAAVVRAVGLPTTRKREDAPVSSSSSWGSDVPHVHIKGNVDAIRSAVVKNSHPNPNTSRTASKKTEGIPMVSGSSATHVVDALTQIRDAIAALPKQRSTMQAAESTPEPDVTLLSGSQGADEARDADCVSPTVNESAWTHLQQLFHEVATSLALHATTVPETAKKCVEVRAQPARDNVTDDEYQRLKEMEAVVRSMEHQEHTDLKTLYSELVSLRAEKLRGPADQMRWATEALSWQHQLIASEVRFLESVRQQDVKSFRAGSAQLTEEEFKARLLRLQDDGKILHQQWENVQRLASSRSQAPHHSDRYSPAALQHGQRSHPCLQDFDAKLEREWKARFDAQRDRITHLESENAQLRAALDRHVSADSNAIAAALKNVQTQWNRSQDMERKWTQQLVAQLIGRSVSWTSSSVSKQDDQNRLATVEVEGESSIVVDITNPLPHEDWSRQTQSLSPSLRLASALIASRDAFAAQMLQRHTAARVSTENDEGMARNSIASDELTSFASLEQLLKSEGASVAQRIAEATAKAAEEATLAVASAKVYAETDDDPINHDPTPTDDTQPPVPRPCIVPETPEAPTSSEAADGETLMAPPSRKRSRSVSPCRSAVLMDPSTEVPVAETPLTFTTSTSSAFAEPEPTAEPAQDAPTPQTCASLAAVIVSPTNPFAEEDGFWDTA
eukprot:CAMPEP_0176447068 /NCGR_PEP_ID=MMETSP0127-20121128/24770_1 /TAXON_ID=938130 /ORGANISM="Platyophrya macrostoma, Strain WH" /LENGTH=780 /DNA_ID=CAMNT_0017833361 /DNA_START=47 /DNA_END=2389 /DNA_ORIENTATION=-